MSARANCDVCDERPGVRTIIVCGIETNVCGPCGGDEDEYDEQNSPPDECEHRVGFDETCERCDEYERDCERAFGPIVLPAPVTTAPGAVRRIAYCRVCNKQIAAETAAENGGNCHAHAVIDTRWRASDDYRR